MKRNSKRSNLKVVVAIGASAGGLESIQALLTHISPRFGRAAIIIAQHMSPTYESKLVELLSRKTHLSVVSAENGASIIPDTIYIGPPNHNVIVKNNCLSLIKADKKGPQPSINELFSSLAHDKSSDIKKIGIILSGTGNDGTAGMRVLKEAGGITIAQSPESAKYSGMPSAAIGSGYIDLSFSAEQIGESLFDMIENKKVFEHKEEIITDKQHVEKLLKILASQVGIDFSNYKTSTIYRRLEKTMNDNNFSNIESYLKHIEENPKEIDILFKNLLIGVTSFFRDIEGFRKIKVIASEIINSKQDNEIIRVWVPGCATGEEAYSLAIIFDELLRKHSFSFQVQIFATDINEKALSAARKGEYSVDSLAEIDENTLHKYFTKSGDETFQLAKHIRKMVLFSKHDVTSNPPFLRIDLISCRNLLIYFDSFLQQQVIPVFHYSLRHNGYLFLGKSETIGDFDYLFSTIDSRFKIFCKRNTTETRYKLPYLKQMNKTSKAKEVPATRNENMTVQKMVKETFYQTFEHPYIVTDERYNLVEVAGELNNLLSIRPGAATMSVLKLIIQELQIELRSVLGKAIRKSEPVRGNTRRVELNDGSRLIRLNAKPLLFSHRSNPLYVVVFEEVDLNTNYYKTFDDDEKDKNPRIVELEQELMASKEHMDSLVEELETYNEELQATNEELQSSNEELQASNEELETSNEELQSTNEELEIAYNELRTASAEIERQNQQIKDSENNLKTVFNNTLQGFILVDDKYVIKTFNKTAFQIFKKTYNKSIKIGDPIIDIFEPEELEDFYRNFKAALQGKLVSDRILVKQNKEADVWLDYNYTPVSDDETDKIVSVNLSFIDSTIQKQLAAERDNLLDELKLKNKKLKNSNKNLDNFFHVIAHDLRSPISNLRLAAHQLYSAEEDEVGELVEIMDLAIDRLDNTITGLIRILEIESESMINEILVVSEVIDEIKSELSRLIVESGAQIKIDIGNHTISYIKEFLRSIIKNLLSNAIKYSHNKEKPVIKLSWKQENNFHLLKIQDEGVGIDLEKYGNRLFKPFKRIKDNKKIGLGVGLHIVKTMVERNGGRIEVESELGKGTTFTAYIKPYTNGRS